VILFLKISEYCKFVVKKMKWVIFDIQSSGMILKSNKLL